MSQRSTFGLGGLLLIVLAAVVGYLLISMPGTILDYYDRAAEHGPIWAYLYIAVVTLGLLIIAAAIGRIVLVLLGNTYRNRKARTTATKDASQMSAAEKQTAIRNTLAQAKTIADELNDFGQDHAAVDQAASALEAKLESKTLEIVAFGTISSGKSSLLNALVGREMFATQASGGTTTQRNEVAWTGGLPGAGVDHIIMVDTPGIGDIDGAAHVRIAQEAAAGADVVLLVLDGPMRDSELATLKLLGQMQKRVLLCLNKVDWYEGEDRKQLLEQIIEQSSPWVQRKDVVAVRARPASRQRIRIKADGSEQSEQVQLDPDLSSLARRMLATIKRDGRDLLLANLLLRSRALVEDARAQVASALDQRAMDIVNSYTWRAGAVAAVVPFPVVDVAAGITISTKMVLELAKVYRQNIDLKAAERLLGQMGKNLVGILGSHAITPAISSLFSAALKTVPAIGTISGGVLQGLTQAVITQWIGRIFIDYFKNEAQLPTGGMAQLARRKWDELTSPTQLAKLARTGLEQLGNKNDE